MDFFQTLAECSVAFAGFAAIHAVLKGGNTGRILHRSFTVVLTGALAFMLSLLVLLLDQLDLPATTLWRIASGIGLTATAVGGFLFYRSHRRLAELGEVAQAPVVFAIAAWLLALPTPAMLLNLGGWLWTPGAAAYGAALTMILGAGVLALVGSFWFPMEMTIKGAERERRSVRGEL
ncbi:MAG: hypothetical protein R3266_11060 [Gemmatimonadota bacterium]|nr:hypothetical protein [Gemmatimonadota bacterium]